jgi:hypothetical protein
MGTSYGLSCRDGRTDPRNSVVLILSHRRLGRKLLSMSHIEKKRSQLYLSPGSLWKHPKKEAMRGWSVPQVIECLPSKHETPSSNPNITKKKV